MSLLALLTGRVENTTGTIQAEFIETQPYEAGFAQHYQQNIRPYVEQFETARKEALRKSGVLLRVAVGVAAVMLCVSLAALGLLNIGQTGVKLLWGVNATIIVVMGLLVYAPLVQYKSSVKTTIFPLILSFFGDYQYRPVIEARIKSLKPWDIIPAYHREKSEDEITGTYKGVRIDVFETCLEKEYRNSKGHKSYRSVFKGMVIILQMHKNFKGKTLIKKDAGRFGNWVLDIVSKLDRVKLEDPVFEKIFEVYSDDQVEARYLLTTAFMERLSRLMQLLKAEAIQCSFYQNKLLMLVPVQHDLFEPGSVFEPEDFIDDTKSLLAETHIIHKIIETLKLDEDIGL